MQKFFLDKYLFIYCFIFQFCKVCNKTFVNVYRLQRYMISYDESTDLRKFKCFECGKVFKFKYYLKEYIRIYSGEKFFECLNCYKRFSYFGFYSSYMIFKKCWVVGLKVYIIERVNYMELIVIYFKFFIFKGVFIFFVYMLIFMV